MLNHQRLHCSRILCAKQQNRTKANQYTSGFQMTKSLLQGIAHQPSMASRRWALSSQWQKAQHPLAGQYPGSNSLGIPWCGKTYQLYRRNPQKVAAEVSIIWNLETKWVAVMDEQPPIDRKLAAALSLSLSLPPSLPLSFHLSLSPSLCLAIYLSS